MFHGDPEGPSAELLAAVREQGDDAGSENCAEFARELAWALVRAAIAGATTRATAELLAAPHGQGHLRTVPSDPACRGSPSYR